MYTFVFLCKLLIYRGFSFIVIHTCHLGFQWRVHPPGSSFRSCFQDIDLLLHLLRSILPLNSFRCWWETPTHCVFGRCSTPCSLLSYIFYGQPIKVYSYIPLKLHAILKKLNELFVANLKWQHQQLMIPSSIPQRFHERNLHICKHIWKNIYFVHVVNT